MPSIIRSRCSAGGGVREMGGWGGGGDGEGGCDVITPKTPAPPRHTCEVQEQKKVSFWTKTLEDLVPV